MSFAYQSFRSTRAIINTQALKLNLNRVREYAPSSQVMAVIKANAYGHGLMAVAKSLDAADAFAIARVDEAVQLRLGGIKKTLIVLGGFNCRAELEVAYTHDLVLVINNSNQFQILMDFIDGSSEKVDKQVKIWLKFDTGMHRLGFYFGELSTIFSQLSPHSKINQPIGIMSHFACADEVDNLDNRKQLDLYQNMLEQLNPGMTSMANSAAIINLPSSHFQWVRAGIMLYGVNPFPLQTGEDIGLQAVMTLQANVIALKALSKGERIGYGSTWQCPEDMDVAVVAIGYGDGYPRHARSGTPVLINGMQTQLLGRVSMDMISIDLRPLKQNNIAVSVGDVVTLWGEGLPVERVAACSDTIGYELLCGVTTRVKFEYLES